MNNPYDLNSWSKLYREEKLAERYKRHLLNQANHRSLDERPQADSALTSILSFLRGGAKFSDTSSLGGSSK